MKAPIIIVEGRIDEIILSRFLPKDVRDRVEFGVANGSTSALSLARSILSVNVRPVVLVMNSDTTDDRLIAERREMIEYSLREASSGCRYKLVLAIPTIEVLLVQDERMLGSLTVGYTVQPFEFAYARQNPKQYLQQRFRCGADYTSCLSDILVNLPADVVFQGVSVGLVNEIVEFIRSIPAREGEPNNGSHADADQALHRKPVLSETITQKIR
jgi:hypothetical protein